MPRKKKTGEQIKIKKEAIKKLAKKKSELLIPFYDVNGKQVESFDLPKEIFQVEGHPKLLVQYVRVYLANQRQGTASTKTRGEVAGSTRKIYRQKGTGRARHGSIKAPIFVGGGVVGGPKPRDFSLKLNKKQKRKALFAALTLQYKNKNILGINDSFLKMEPKTKIFINFLKKMDLDKQKLLLIFPKLEKNNLLLAARNIPQIEFNNASSINPYLVLNSEKIIFVDKALEVLINHFLNRQKN